jgi:hypothetical protein
MADDGIRVSISPSSVTGGGGRRLTEASPSQSPSFVSDKFGGGGGPRYAAPGTDAKAQIAVEKQAVASQTALVAELRALRTEMRRTAISAGLGSPEYAALRARANEIHQIQRANVGVFAPGASDARASAGSRQGQGGVAYQPGTRAGDVLRGIGAAGLGIGATGLGVAGAAWSGQSGVGIAMLGADLGLRAGIPLARGAWGLGKSAIGAAFGAGAGEAGAAGAVAGEAVTAGAVAETAGGVLAALGGWPVIVTAVTAALGVGAYEYVRNRGAVNRAVGDVASDIGGLPRDLVALALARQYGAAEVPRQALAYRYGRSFQESGQSMIGASTGGRWSSLGINAADSTAMLGGARELAGADILSNRGAYRSLRTGVCAGLSNEQNVSATGGFARLGADPEESIRIIAEGTMRGGQSGLQGEVLKAQLDFLRTQSQRTVISNPTEANRGISALATLLQASGIPALRGAGAISAIQSMGAAFDSSSILDETKIGQSLTMAGQAKLLRAAQTAKHLTGYTDAEVAKMGGDARTTEALRIMDRGFANTGADLSMFLKYGVATSIEEAKKSRLTLDSLEKAWGLARGRATDEMVTGKLLADAMTGDYNAFNRDRAQVTLKTTGMISPGAAGEARLSHTEAATGERVMGTYIKTLDLVEKKSLDVLDSYLAGGTAPGTPLPGGPGGAKLRSALKGTGAMSALPATSAPDYGHMTTWPGGGGATGGIAAAIAFGIRAIIADLDKLVEYAAHSPSPGTTAYPVATPLPPSHPAASGPPAHGKVVPPAHHR